MTDPQLARAAAYRAARRGKLGRFFARKLVYLPIIGALAFGVGWVVADDLGFIAQPAAAVAPSVSPGTSLAAISAAFNEVAAEIIADAKAGKIDAGEFYARVADLNREMAASVAALSIPGAEREQARFVSVQLETADCLDQLSAQPTNETKLRKCLMIHEQGADAWMSLNAVVQPPGGLDRAE